MNFSGWKKKQLGDILNFRRGHDLTRKEIKSGIYPVVGSNGIIGFHNKFTTKSPCITIGRSGNVGNPHIVYEKAWAHNTTLYIDDFKGNNPQFVYYFLKNLNLGYYAGGSAVPTLNRNHIHPLEVYFPIALEEQNAIANLLTLLDEKVELNNQTNQTLEEMAQAIFKHWFVDFEFPNENGEPYNSSGGKFVESELGMIPERWKVVPLSEIGNLLMGLSPKSSTYNENGEGMPLLNGAADFNGKLIAPTKYTTDPKRICDQGDLLFCVRATIGNIVYADKQYSIGRGVASITPKKVCYSEFIYYILNKEMDHLISNATGSVFLNLKKSDINNMKIALPSKRIIENTHNILNQLQSKINYNEQQNQILINLRDTLIPKLMSGEIRIPDAEQEVEACLQKTN